MSPPNEQRQPMRHPLQRLRPDTAPPFTLAVEAQVWVCVCASFEQCCRQQEDIGGVYFDVK